MGKQGILKSVHRGWKLQLIENVVLYEFYHAMLHKGTLPGFISAVSVSSIIHGHTGHKPGVIITRGYTVILQAARKY